MSEAEPETSRPWPGRSRAGRAVLGLLAAGAAGGLRELGWKPLRRRAAARRCRSARWRRRPNIVFVLADDLSSNLVPLHAARARDGAARRDVHELLRDRLALLPEPHLDLHRPVPARLRRLQQHRDPTAGIARSTGTGDVRRTFARRAATAAATAPRSWASTSTATSRTCEAHFDAAVRPRGLERVGRRRQRLPRVQLRPEREPPRRPLRPRRRRPTSPTC